MARADPHPGPLPGGEGVDPHGAVAGGAGLFTRAVAVALGLVVVVLGLLGCNGPRGELEPLPDPHDLAQADAGTREKYLELRRDLDERLTDSARGRTEDETLALARAYQRLGQWLFAYRYRELAAIALRDGRRLAPDSYDWDYLLGVNALRAGDASRARRHLEQALEQRPKYLPALVALAEIAAGENRLEDARAQLTRALEIDPRSPRVLYELGQLALQEGDSAGAVRHLSAALAGSPGTPSIHQALGMAYRAAGDRQLALEHLELAEGGDSGMPPMLNDPLVRSALILREDMRSELDRAGAAAARGRHRLAIAAYERAIRAAPEAATPRITYARYLTIRGRHGAAAEQLAEALRLEPENPDALYELGLLAEARGERAAARDRFEQALRVDPGHRGALLRLAGLLRRDGELEAAAARYRRVLELEPARAEAAVGLAAVLLDQGREPAARAVLDQAASLDPDDESVALLLVRVLAAAESEEVRDPARAVALAAPFVEARPNAAWAESYAMALFAVGEAKRALAWQQVLVDALRRERESALVKRAERALASYRRGRAERGVAHDRLGRLRQIVLVPPPDPDTDVAAP